MCKRFLFVYFFSHARFVCAQIRSFESFKEDGPWLQKRTNAGRTPIIEHNVWMMRLQKRRNSGPTSIVEHTVWMRLIGDSIHDLQSDNRERYTMLKFLNQLALCYNLPQQKNRRHEINTAHINNEVKTLEATLLTIYNLQTTPTPDISLAMEEIRLRFDVQIKTTP